MDKIKAQVLREALEEVAVLIESRHNVKMHVGGGRFSPSSLTFKVELAEIGENGEVKSQEAEDFRLMASSYGLSPDDLGREFTSNCKTFKITGLSTRKRKYPILGEEVSTGKKYKFPADQVRMALSLSKGEKVVAKVGLTDEIKKQFSNLACALSPENLHCDGEISPAQARVKHSRLMKEWKALEIRVGRKVKEEEVWDWE